MASTTSNTIILKSNNPDNMAQRTRQNLGNGAIVPGELLVWATADVDQHATAGGNAQGKKVAIENPFSDHGTGKAIDHAYADNETVSFIFAGPGDQLYMWLKDGQTAALGSVLVSDGAGALQVHTPQAVNEAGSATFTSYVDAIVGYAAEAAAPSGARGRIRVDIA